MLASIKVTQIPLQTVQTKESYSSQISTIVYVQGYLTLNHSCSYKLPRHNHI